MYGHFVFGDCVVGSAGFVGVPAAICESAVVAIVESVAIFVKVNVIIKMIS